MNAEAASGKSKNISDSRKIFLTKPRTMQVSFLFETH